MYCRPKFQAPRKKSLQRRIFSILQSFLLIEQKQRNVYCRPVLQTQEKVAGEKNLQHLSKLLFAAQEQSSVCWRPGLLRTRTKDSYREESSASFKIPFVSYSNSQQLNKIRTKQFVLQAWVSDTKKKVVGEKNLQHLSKSLFAAQDNKNAVFT